MSNNHYDLIIIGGGPAGLTSGLYASRAKLNTLLIEKTGCGGLANLADWIENYPGFSEGLSGFDLSRKIEEHSKKFGLNIVSEEVLKIQSSKNNEKIVKTKENEYRALSIIIATGTEYQTLNIPGENEFRGKGVSFCATCDGPFFKNKNILVVGGGNSAVQEAIYLTRFANKVTIVHRRDKLRATKILQEQAMANPKISFLWATVLTKIFGKEQVAGAHIKNLSTGKEETFPVDGIFIYIGLIPNTKIFNGMIRMDEKGYIITDENMNTTSEGFFACGDVRKKILRQIVTAAGDGALAALSAQEYVDGLKGTKYDNI